MNRRLRTTLKVFAIVIAVVAALLIGATLLLNSHRVQQKLLHKATTMLSERLGTAVSADSIHVSLFGPTAALYGLRVDDQQGQPLLYLGEAKADLAIHSLLKRSATVKQLEVNHLKAMLVKPDSNAAANYQFLIDSLRKATMPEAKAAKPAHKGEPLHIELNQVRLTDASLTYKFITRDHTGSIGRLDIRHKDDGFAVRADSVRFKTDNHRPRKNTGKPKRGWFDAGHLDFTASLQGTLLSWQADSLAFVLDNATVTDSIAGFHVKDLRLKGHGNRQHLYLSNISLVQGATSINVADATFTLPSKKQGRMFRFQTGDITAHVVLKDIARLFAPVALKNFRLPLDLKARMTGEGKILRIPSARVTTSDKKFSVSASGRIDIGKKRKTVVNFDVHRMQARQGSTEKIISQFPVKRLMMDQLHMLGDIGYKGHFTIRWRNEAFRGRLTTAAGPVDFQFTIDGLNKWLTGKVDAQEFRLGEVMKLKKVGPISCQAAFKVDISKQRTAKVRRSSGGTLPIGSLSATIDDSSYQGIHFRNVDATVDCDGTNAEGKILKRGKRIDLSTLFTYTQINHKGHLKLSHPHIGFHKKRTSKKEQEP
ncbi:MAG: hypothetical protein IJ553_00790 [Alloprevotella sp.]|nr:hypothetical protein [Alloprevotella sp.]